MSTTRDMLYQFGGVPVGIGRFCNPWGKHYFVDATSGSNNDSGTTPTNAYSTIAYAVGKAVAGDVIYIRPQTYKLGTGFNRYTEDVTVTLGGDGGSGVVATNANMSIIGVTPQVLASTDFMGVRWKHTTATQLTVDAPCLHVENIGFFNEGGTNAINLRCNGATRTQEGTTGFSLYNCTIKGDGGFYANGCTDVTIANCRFIPQYSGTVGGINMVGSTNAVQRPVIKNCEFLGAGNANNCKTPVIIGAAPWYDAIIRDCYFLMETDTGVYISISGTNTGTVANCYFASADMSTTSIVASGMEGAGCYDTEGIQAAPIA